MARKRWRCFHCDEVFSSARSAREHFGADQGATPACKIRSHEGHLITYIRQLEEDLAQYRAEDSHVLRALWTLEADHRQALIREEEKGYARGVRDMQAQGLCVEPSKHSQPAQYEDGEAPWSEDEQFDEEAKACKARCKQYGKSGCPYPDHRCDECQDDAQVVLRRNYKPSASSLSRPHGGVAE